MTRRIPALWSRLQATHTRALVPFVTAGYPTRRVTIEAITAAADAGADMIEIGVPFSDPVADGPAIQHSSHVALENGVDLRWILNTVARARRSVDVPILLMGYYNPFLRYGLKSFCRDAVASGVDGVIVPDLPPDEGREFKGLAEASGLSMVFLIAPTTTAARVRAIGRASTDFSYCVAVTGVTGARAGVAKTTEAYLKRVRKTIRKPIVVGFGVSRPAHVRRLGRYADGVVVGSALVPVLAKAVSGRTGMVSLGKMLRPLVAAAHLPFRGNGAKQA